MVYNVTRYNGTPLATVQDSTLDTASTSITLIGRNAVNFGLALNENFVALLQNFANTTPPPQPQQGQIWFDSVSSSLKVYDGLRWLLVTPPFDGNAGTAAISVTPSVEVLAFFSAGQIVSVVSHETLSPSQLAEEVEIAGTSYQFKDRFPNGLMPGINLASDTNGYRFVGTASSANVLASARNITVNGSISGSTLFDGSNDVVITTTLPNVLNTAINTSSFWSKVQVSGNGLVTDANVIVGEDVYLALGYTPPSDVRITGSAFGNAVANGTVYSVNITLSSTGISAGTYSNVTVDSYGRVVAGNNSGPVPQQGIIMMPNTVPIPSGWYICNGQTVTVGGDTYVLPNLTANQIGSTVWVMRIV